MPHKKLAYEQGVRQAMEDAGLMEKEAIIGGAIGKTLRQGKSWIDKKALPPTAPASGPLPQGYQRPRWSVVELPHRRQAVAAENTSRNPTMTPGGRERRIDSAQETQRLANVPGTDPFYAEQVLRNKKINPEAAHEAARRLGGGQPMVDPGHGVLSRNIPAGKPQFAPSQRPLPFQRPNLQRDAQGRLVPR